MREGPFRRFLSQSLGERTISSYVAYIGRAERVLGLDLDRVSLDETGIANIGDALLTAGVASASVSNIKSALNSYAAFRLGGGPSRCVAKAMPAPISARSPLTAIVRDASDLDLMRFQVQIIDELRDRGVVRTGNGPIGDYAEKLFADAFGWTLTKNSAAGHDAMAQGIFYQIKARRIGHTGGSRQLGAIRRLPERLFHTLAACLFDANFDIVHAVLIPHDLVVKFAKPSPHTNSWRLMLTDPLCRHSGVTDVTTVLRAFQATARDRKLVAEAEHDGDRAAASDRI